MIPNENLHTRIFTCGIISTSSFTMNLYSESFLDDFVVNKTIFNFSRLSSVICSSSTLESEVISFNHLILRKIKVPLIEL